MQQAKTIQFEKEGMISAFGALQAAATKLSLFQSLGRPVLRLSEFVIFVGKNIESSSPAPSSKPMHLR